MRIRFWLSSILLALASGFAGASEFKPDLSRGAELFRTCLVCHGPDGAGTQDGNVPVIAGQHTAVIAKELRDFRTQRRWDYQMERIAGKHILKDGKDILDIAAYVNAMAPPGSPETGDGTFLARGEAVYQAQCATCHGARAEGSQARSVPRLAGQHFSYLLRQMYNAADARRPNMSATHIRRVQGLVMEEFQGIADYLSRIGATKGDLYPVRKTG
jgi:cytochrome c553